MVLVSKPRTDFMKNYILEIYSSGSIEDTEAVIESDTPFMAMNVGDILNSRMWETGSGDGKLLKVVKLEHFIWQNGEKAMHKIGVMTESVEDTEEVRFG